MKLWVETWAGGNIGRGRHRTCSTAAELNNLGGHWGQSNVGPDEACPFSFHPIRPTQCNTAHMADGGLRRGQAAPGTTDTGPHCLNIRLEREVPPALHGKGTLSDFIFQGPSLPRYPPTTPISEEEIKAFCRRCWQTQGRGSREGGSRGHSVLSSHSVEVARPSAWVSLAETQGLGAIVEEAG